MTTEQIESVALKILKDYTNIDFNELKPNDLSVIDTIDLEKLKFKTIKKEIEQKYDKREADEIIEILSHFIEAIEVLQTLDDDTEGFEYHYEPQFSKEFPFFGAGNAHYFEYLGLTIRFQSEPNAKLKQQILKRLPQDYNANIDDFNKKMLNLYMQYGYDGMAVFYDDGFEKLNSDIEKALLELHTIAPIQFVYRHEDTEADGTAFSKWHTYSGEVLLEPTISAIEKELDVLESNEIRDLRDYFEEICKLYNQSCEGLFERIK